MSEQQTSVEDRVTKLSLALQHAHNRMIALSELVEIESIWFAEDGHQENMTARGKAGLAALLKSEAEAIERWSEEFDELFTRPWSEEMKESFAAIARELADEGGAR